MFRVGGEERCILDLNKEVNGFDTYLKGEFKRTFEIEVESLNDGMMVPWRLITSTWIKDAINVSKRGERILHIELDAEKFNRKGIIILENFKKERAFVDIIPNIEFTSERSYDFYIDDVDYTKDGKTAIISVTSKSNYTDKSIGDKERFEPWEIKYDGKPLTYEFLKTDKSISLTLLSNLVSEHTSKIIISQTKTEKDIEILVKHKDKNSIEILKGILV